MLFLDHTIIPARDKVASAQFFAHVMGLEYKGPWGHFAPVHVNDTLSMDFDDRENFESHHYAFLATDEEFDTILGRIRDEGLTYGSGPRSWSDGQINHLHGGRGFYFPDPNGHIFEVITHTYV